MNTKEYLLSRMSDEELARTIKSVKTMVNSGNTYMAPAIILLVKEVSKRPKTKNKELIEFQDCLVNKFQEKMEKGRFN